MKPTKNQLYSETLADLPLLHNTMNEAVRLATNAALVDLPLREAAKISDDGYLAKLCVSYHRQLRRSLVQR